MSPLGERAAGGLLACRHARLAPCGVGAEFEFKRHLDVDAVGPRARVGSEGADHSPTPV